MNLYIHHLLWGGWPKPHMRVEQRGIRANTVEDILEIRKNVSLPIIGIIKEVYDNSEVYITPTLKEVDALMEIKPEIIAVDATKRIRPDGTYLKEFLKK